MRNLSPFPDESRADGALQVGGVRNGGIMDASIKTEQAIFVAAVGQVPPDQWEAYAREACAGDEQLLAARAPAPPRHAGAGSFLDVPAPDLWATADEQPIREVPGTVIGPYKLLEQIGEGGFGVVFMAEQTQPVRRKVALKVLKPGMDTRQVVARFEAERQALAIMDHPNIAKVLDGGRHAIRPAVLRHGAGQGRADHRVLRPEPPDAPATAGAVRTRLPGGAARPPEGHHPPRPEAVQRAGHGA